MAETEQPLIEVPTTIVPGKDKTTPVGDRYSMKKVTVSEIATAMIAAKGDAKIAADSLGVRVGYIKKRISVVPDLRARFGKNAVATRQKIILDKMEAEGFEVPHKVDVIAKQLDELAVGQAQIAQMAMTRLNEIQQRMKLGNKAKEFANFKPEQLTPEDLNFYLRNKFATGPNGEPIEERMLLEQEQAMMHEYSRANESCSVVALKKAQTESLLRKIGREKTPPRRPTAPPKGSLPVTTINNGSGGQIIVQASQTTSGS